MTRRASPAARRVLDEAGGLRAMTGVLAIMLFLTLLAAAAGLGTLHARALLARQVAGRLTVQLPYDPAATARALAALTAAPDVARTRAVDAAEMRALLRPWLGSDAADADLPVPTLIDVDLRDDTPEAAARVAAAVRRVVPAAAVDRHETWMSPVTRLMSTAVAVAFALVLLMAAATAGVVVLAARAGLETHRATIEVMHMLGSTDRQVARLFQRRLALDAAVGGVVGGAGAAAVLWLVSRQLSALGSDLLGGVGLAGADWVVLAALPVLFVGLATLAARVAVTGALRRSL